MKKRNKSTLVIAVALGCATITLAGCTTSEPVVSATSLSQNDPLEILDVSDEPIAIKDDSSVSRDIDRYLPNAGKILELATAREAVVSKCLQQHGLTERYSLVTSELTRFVNDTVRDRVTRSPLWGFFDVSAASQSGYQRSASSGSITIPALSEEGTRSCLAQDDADADPLQYLFEGSLPNGGPPVPRDHPVYRKAVESWSACMEQKGFQYSDPQDPINEYSQQPQVLAAQRSVAEADVECKISTNLVGIALTVQKAYDRKYVEENLGSLRTMAEHIDSQIRSAAE